MGSIPVEGIYILVTRGYIHVSSGGIPVCIFGVELHLLYSAEALQGGRFLSRYGIHSRLTKD